MKIRKVLGLLCVSLATSWASFSYANEVAPPPVLWLGFNGNYNDSNSISTASPPHDVYGVLNAAFTNDVPNATCGTSNLFLPGDGSYVEADNVSDLNFNTGSPFSVSAWVKTTNGGGGLIWAKSTALADQYGDEHTVECYVGTGDTADNGDGEPVGTVVVDVFYVNGLVSTRTVNDGNWHHVVVTHSANNVWSLYIDGVLDTTGSFGAANEGANDEGPWSFTVGATLNGFFPLETGTYDPWTGEIDEVGVWNSVLSSNQVAIVYTNGIPSQTIYITQQPENAEVISGNTATFSVAGTLIGISGTLNYQWQSNGVPVVGATSASYTTPVLNTNADGAVYNCLLSVGSVSVLSADATVHVVAPLTPSLAPSLYLRFENSLADLGYPGGHLISGQSLSATYDGTYSSDVANANNGNYSLSLTGDGSYVQATNVGDLNFNTGQPFTVSTWIKTTANGVIWAKSPAAPDAGGANHTMACYVNDGSFYHGGNNDYSVGTVTFDTWYSSFGWTSTKAVNDGKWHNVVCVYNGTGTWSIYIDGFLDSSGTPGGGGANEGANSDAGTWDFTVGATYNANYPNEGVAGDPFTGNIDEVAVWGQVLTANEVASLYASGMPSTLIGISQEPAYATENVGQSATFQVAAALVGASGTLNYQWQSNGVDIAGATSPTYTTPPLSIAADGSIYRCHITYGTLSVYSVSAALAVLSPAPTPVLYLPFNGNYLDLGTGSGQHVVEEVAGLGTAYNVWLNPVTTYDGTFSTDVANATCGSDSLSLVGDSSFIIVTNVSDVNVNNPFTISAWIKLTDGEGTIAAKALTSDPSQNNPTFHVQNGQLLFDCFYQNIVSSLDTIPNGVWTHVSAVYDGTNATLYINGVPDGSGLYGPCNEGANGESPWAFSVGCSLNAVAAAPYPFPTVGDADLTYSDSLTGQVDEVAFWDKALTPGQIKYVYQHGIPVVGPALSISRSAGNVVISWAGTGYKLQENSNLTNPAGWTDVAGGTTSPVTVTIGSGSQFFRLVSQ